MQEVFFLQATASLAEFQRDLAGDAGVKSRTPAKCCAVTSASYWAERHERLIMTNPVSPLRGNGTTDAFGLLLGLTYA